MSDLHEAYTELMREKANRDHIEDAVQFKANSPFLHSRSGLMPRTLNECDFAEAGKTYRTLEY